MTFANNLRQQLEQIKDFEYFLFNSRYTGNETELTKKIVHFFPMSSCASMPAAVPAPCGMYWRVWERIHMWIWLFIPAV